MTITKNELKKIIDDNTESLRDYTARYNLTPYPMYFEATDDYVFSIAFKTEHSGVSDSKEHTTVIAFCGNDQWMIFCGDDFLSGDIDDSEKNRRIDNALRIVPSQNHETVRPLMESSYNLSPKNSSCNNSKLWSNFTRAKSTGRTVTSNIVCKHIKNMFAAMPEDTLELIEKEYRNHMRVAKLSKTDNQIVDMLNNYGFQGESILVVGPGGHGKTHTVKDYAIKHNLTFVEAQGHSEMDALELFGYDKMYGDQMVWFDGPVSEAALLASKGHKTILFIDEFTNIPLKEAASLKACFEPYNGHYYFHTGKINEIVDGRAKKEIIKVPVENIQIVAAANMGSGYAAEELDKALKQRFMVAYYEASNPKVEKTLKTICAAKGFSLDLIPKLMKFKAATEDSAKQGLISEPAVLRHLSRKILGLMKSEDLLAEVALSQINQWIEFDVDGRPVKEQQEIIEDIISATLE